MPLDRCPKCGRMHYLTDPCIAGERASSSGRANATAVLAVESATPASSSRPHSSTGSERRTSKARVAGSSPARSSNTAGSSNGRTSAFEVENAGSTPAPAATRKGGRAKLPVTKREARKAINEFERRVAAVTGEKKPSRTKRLKAIKADKKDRHTPGYMADYMRKRRAKQKDGKQ